MAEWHLLTRDQVSGLIEILDHPTVLELMDANAWYNQFVPSIRIDLIKQQIISERQLYCIRKLADLTKQQWRIVL
jgi:hypothetical protein